MLHITPQSNTVKKFNDLSELTNSVYLKVNDDSKEFQNREHVTFNKIQPNKEDLQALNEITEALVTTQPENTLTPFGGLFGRRNGKPIEKLNGHKGLAKAVSKIINNDILVKRKCIMILKMENPQAKDHYPVTQLNTIYMTITSVIDGCLKEHQVIHQ